MAFDPTSKGYKSSSAKPLPVVLLLDVSGSMSGEKINALNSAVRQMLHEFPKFAQGEQMILTAAITFGDEVRLHMPYTKAADAASAWTDLDANGMTPLGTALRMAKDMIEDRSVTPSPCKTIHAILVSDGWPNDDWQGPMDAFINSGRSMKALRMAMAIGDDADENMLNQFIAGSTDLNGNPIELFHADNAADITKFFKNVTQSVKTTSTNPAKPSDSKHGTSNRPGNARQKPSSVDDNGID